MAKNDSTRTPRTQSDAQAAALRKIGHISKKAGRAYAICELLLNDGTRGDRFTVAHGNVIEALETARELIQELEETTSELQVAFESDDMIFELLRPE